MRNVSTKFTCEIYSVKRFESYATGDRPQEEKLTKTRVEVGCGKLRGGGRPMLETSHWRRLGGRLGVESSDLPHGSVELVELV